MYHTWFFQKRLSDDLNKILEGLKLVECFSQQKDELILSFANQTREFHIKADLGSQSGIVSFQKTFSRAKRNSVDLFSGLQDRKVEAVSCFQHERSFCILFEGGSILIFKMHGTRSNILVASENQIKEIFRGNLVKDWEISPSGFGREEGMSENLFAQLVGKKHLSLLPNPTVDFEQMIPQMLSGEIYIGLRNNKPILSFFCLEDPILVTKSAVEASNKFSELHYRFGLLAQEKKGIISHIQKRIKQAENYIKKTSVKLEEVVSARNPEEIGHLIMANMHQIKEGEKQVELDDLYGHGTLTVKLNPRLSPQKNAETYYRKSKNRKIEVEKLEENLDHKKVQLGSLNNDLERVVALQDIREVRKLGEQLNQGIQATKKAPKPYHEFSLDGWQILVGKNAKTNDELTQRVAKKNDLWLHAKDVSGSHVVVKERPGQNFPKKVIEKAAALAAYYSKRKTDSLCPVIYTPKKYVRKVKGTPTGQVMVDREEIVMVEPNDQL